MYLQFLPRIQGAEYVCVGEQGSVMPTTLYRKEHDKRQIYLYVWIYRAQNRDAEMIAVRCLREMRCCCTLVEMRFIMRSDYFYRSIHVFIRDTTENRSISMLWLWNVKGSALVRL